MLLTCSPTFSLPDYRVFVLKTYRLHYFSSKWAEIFRKAIVVDAKSILIAKNDLDPKCHASSYFKAEKSNKKQKKEKKSK